MFGEERAQNYMRRTSPTVKHRVDQSCFGPFVRSSGMGKISLVDGSMDSIKYQKTLGAYITTCVKKTEDEKRMASTTG